MNMESFDISCYRKRIDILADGMKNKVKACIKTKYPHKIASEFDIPEFGPEIISILSVDYPTTSIYVRYGHVLPEFCKCDEMGRDYCNWMIVVEPFWL